MLSTKAMLKTTHQISEMKNIQINTIHNLCVILLSRYILSIEKAEEIEEYVGDLLQGTDGRKRHFIDELLRRWKKTQTQATDSTNLFLLTESVPLTGR